GQDLPAEDGRDEAFAKKGFVGTRTKALIRDASGRTVWDLSAFSFLNGPVPDTVNPSLWRHARLMAMNGLFKVTDRIYQVRGFDLANTTFVRGDTG
ncbi:MBL fold metallo-hydrolase, partial [Acinetobacter baumannii]